MVAINFVGLWLLYSIPILLFVIGFFISQRCNSKYLFRIICIISSLFVLYLPLFLKWYSPWPLANIHVLFLGIVISLLLMLKFLEWGFGRDWSELRKTTVKQVAIDFSSYPQYNLSSQKLLSLDIRDIYRGNIIMLFRALIQFIILRILIHATPEEWFSLPMSLLTPFVWPIRYAMLSFILYISIAMVTNITFSVSGLIWMMPMNSTFPAFPFTSCSIREFWSDRWNIFVKQLLHRTSFIVLPHWLGMSKTMSNTVRGLISFLISGILHELLFTLSTDRWSGKNMLFFLLHAVFVTMEIAWYRMKKPVYPTKTFLRWLRTIGLMLITSPLFFDPWIQAGYFVSLKENLS